MKSKGQSFVSGAATLMMAAVIVKIIGALFKIPLTRILGGEGMGYYMTAYSVFNPIYALSVAGFPVAVSKLTASAVAKGRRKDRQRIMSVALVLFPLIGLLLFAVIYFAAPFFVVAIGNQNALKAVRAIAPAVFFCCITSVFRGYYEGSRNMVPTALSQVVEAVIKLFVGLYLAFRCVEGGIHNFNITGSVFGVMVADRAEAMTVIAPHAAAAAVSGVAISTAAGSLVIALFHAMQKNESVPGQSSISLGKTASLLMGMALPVSAGALVTNISSLIDLVSVMNRISFAAQHDWEALCRSHPDAMLQSMQAERVANFLYGSYTGLAITIFNLVPALTAAIGTCALPMIAALASQGRLSQLRQQVESVIRVTIIIAMPMGLGICCLSGPILSVVFDSNPIEVAIATRLLRPMGIAAVFVAVTGAVNSMLQAVGRVYVPVKMMLGGAAIKFLVNWALISIPSVNISGAPWGTLGCYLFIMLGGTAVLMRTIDGDIGLFPMFLKPLFASVLCCMTALSVLSALTAQYSDKLALVLAIICGGSIYLVTLLFSGAIQENDLYLLKSDSKIKKLLLLWCKSPCKSRCNAVK